jgi:hypothetical protein
MWSLKAEVNVSSGRRSIVMAVVKVWREDEDLKSSVPVEGDDDVGFMVLVEEDNEDEEHK